MTTDRHLERDLPAILGEIAMGRYPDYIDDVLATTAQRRQRPGWTFPERWIPVDLATKALPGAPRLPWRAMGVLVLLALLLGAIVAVYVGSNQRALPAPFGPAANGVVVFAQAGDIYTADPVTGKTTAIVTGPETDDRPVYSPDGTHVVFERKVTGDAGPGWLYVARDDGGGLVRVTPDALRGLAEWSVSPDGRSIVALVNNDVGPQILIMSTAGRGRPAVFDGGATALDGSPRYRADGSEILFIGRQQGTGTRGLYALDPATSAVRTIVTPSATADVHSAAWSPDGTRVAYAVFDPTANVRSTRTHVVLADGSGDILVDANPDSIADGGSVWSNDGTRLIINRFYAGGPDDIARSAVVPIDRSDAGVDIECHQGALPDDCTADWIWSPDDTVLLGTWTDANEQPQQALADPLTGAIQPAPWTAAGFATWQRVAR